MSSLGRVSMRFESDSLGDFVFLHSYLVLLLSFLCFHVWFDPLVGIHPNPGPGSKPAVVVVKEVVSKGRKSRSRKIISAGRKVTGRDVGASLGGFLGNAAQKAIASIMGSGDYVVKENSIYNGMINSTGPPKFIGKTMTPGCVQVTHREYIQDVVSLGAAFNLATFPINPTNSLTFPWLSLIADNFESYRFRGLVFEFITTSGTSIASTNTALGTVIMATQYNLDDPRFISKTQMEQYEYAVSTVPFESAIHPIECQRGSGVLEYLYTYLSGVGDARFSTFGQFSLATVGQQAGAIIGELWVSYDIELCKSRLSPYPSLSTYHTSFTPSNGVAFTVGSNSDIFGTLSSVAIQSLDTQNNLAVTLGTAATGGANAIQLLYDAVGTYLVVISFAATSVFNVTFSGAFTGAGASMVNRFGSAGGPLTFASYSAPNNSSLCQLAMQESTFRVLPGNAPNVVPAMSLGSTISMSGINIQYIDLMIVQLPT